MASHKLLNYRLSSLIKCGICPYFIQRRLFICSLNERQKYRSTKLLNINVNTSMSGNAIRQTRSKSDAHGRKNKHFKQLAGEVDTSSDIFQKNVSASKITLEKYEHILSLATGLGGEKAIDRHINKNKKTLVTDRLKMLFDDVDEILEVGAFAGIGMQYGNIPRAGIFAGIGKIRGIYCVVIANDATVKAGTVFPIGVKKQLRMQEIAEKNKLPTIYLVDSGGAFLPLQAEIFLPGGKTFYNEAILSSLGIPQLAIVCGSCTAGAAYLPTMAQEAIMVHKIGTIFLGGPPLVFAALGEVVSPEKLGGATLHCSVSGCADHFAETEEDAIEMGRDVVSTYNIESTDSRPDIEEPLYDPAELFGIIPAKDQHKMDMYQVIARIVDGSRFQEFKALFGPTLLAGFAYIQGTLVGILGNQGPMTERAALKGSHFVQMCDQRGVPIIFLQNSTPETNSVDNLAQGEEMGIKIRCQAQLMSSVAVAQVPKVTVICGNSFGEDNYMMCGRSFDPRFVFCWPNAKIGISSPEELCEALTMDELKTGEGTEETKKIAKAIEDKVALQTSPVYSSGNLWDDGIIRPQDTRKVLARCVDIFRQQPSFKAINHAAMRM